MLGLVHASSRRIWSRFSQELTIFIKLICACKSTACEPQVTPNSLFLLQDVHKDLWKGSNRKFSKIPWHKIEMQRHNAERTPEQQVGPASNYGYAVFSSAVMQLLL